jgi:O-phosphoseryl-tRNA synthetase
MKAAKKGVSHPIHDLIEETRKVFFDMGFTEVENPIFIPEDDVYKQYGSEAPVILDRCYYLAGLPRPDIGLGKKQVDTLKEMKADFDFDSFTKILREYREGAIEGDNLTEEMVGRLRISMDDAVKVISLIPQFKSITPVPSKLTLRSHMTAAWYQTLASMQDSCEYPIKLFSIGLRFRREQKVDATHLRAHYGASCVIMDKDFTLEEGKKISSDILSALGFGGNRFELKKATANYYEKGTEYEVYSEKIEIADCGLYSKASLSSYEIKHPVFNLGFGLERILMLRLKKADIREIMYPQLYSGLELTDKDIAEKIAIDRKPVTEEGRKLAGALKATFLENGDAASPCRFLSYDGSFLGKKIEVFAVEREEKTKLLGPAAYNDLFVYDGSVYGIPKDAGKLDKKMIEVREKGVFVGFSFLDALVSLFAAEVEDRIKKGESEGFVQVKMAKTPSDVNINVNEVARRFISSMNKSISVKGPVFTAIEFRVK